MAKNIPLKFKLSISVIDPTSTSDDEIKLQEARCQCQFETSVVEGNDCIRGLFGNTTTITESFANQVEDFIGKQETK